MRLSACALFLALAACEAEAPQRAANRAGVVASELTEQVGASDLLDPELLVLQVARDGTVIVDGRWLLEDETILTRVQTFHAKHPAGRAELRCDPSTLHGRGVRILELLQEGEVSRVSML